MLVVSSGYELGKGVGEGAYSSDDYAGPASALQDCVGCP